MFGKVKVYFDRAHFSARMNGGKSIAGPILAQQVIDDSRPFTPHDQGTLEDTGHVERVGEDYAATWNTVYAAYQWYGCWPDGSHVVRRHDTSINAQATTQWAERAREQHGEEWAAVFQREHIKGAFK